MKLIVLISSLLLLLIIVAGCAPGKVERDILFQTTPFITLDKGYFEGKTACGIVKKHGDFGLGTFNGLDGEMIILGNQIYQVKYDGKVLVADDAELTPFAATTYLDPDIKLNIGNTGSFEDLQKYLDGKLPTLNTIFAMKITGTFPYIKTRSVPEFQKPFPTLNEAIKKQSVFELTDVPGTIVCFRIPAYIGALNVPGYHCHFLSDDRKAGGHLLDCRINNASALIDDTSYYYMEIPIDSELDSADLVPAGGAAAPDAEK